MRVYERIVLLVLLAIAGFAQAETLEELIAGGKLEARVLVDTPAPHFQKAPIVVVVEVGTPDDFSKGTRVRDFTVPGTVIRPTTRSAFNETRRRDDATWAYQSVRFQVLAERAGELRLPAVSTFISVETGTNSVLVEGEVRLQAPVLKIEAPPGTEDLDSWVAATEFKIDESWEGVLDEHQVGDAVTRVRRFTIEEVPAMAIPASPQVELDGVQIYQAPPLVDDKAVGASIQGIREERVVFTLTSGGSYTIPDHRVHWFNLKTKAVEQIDLPGRTLKVAGGSTKAPAIKSPEPEERTGSLTYWVLAILTVALAYFLFRWVLRTEIYRYARSSLEVLQARRRARADFMRAASAQDSRRCLALLYERMSEHAEWQLRAVCASDPQLNSIFDALMANAYGDGPPLDSGALQLLWDACAAPKQKQDNLRPLRLNPGPNG